MGFAIPIDIWLRNDLKDWAESLLNEKKIKEDGIFNSNEIKEIWNIHQSGKKGLQSELWNILIFQSWKEQWL
jgi:asparagine synthase (glutamine-hydrolysing)